MAKKPLQHKIDDAAKRIFKEIFDDISWNADLRPDYGIDYRVQFLDNENNISPDVCLVQLKGHKSFKHVRHNNQRMIKHSLRVDRLKDYLDKYKEPVFLVVVDTNTKDARFIFMQNYPDSGLLPPNWNNQESVGILIPDTNDLHNRTLFRRALNSAITYMTEKYPGSITAALRNTKKRYQEVDPRFDIHFEFSGDKVVSTQFVAREPFELKMEFSLKGTHANDRINRLIQSGLPTDFTYEEVQFHGSPLLDELRKSKQLTIQFGQTHKIFISLIRLDSDGREIARLDGISGQLTAGTKEYHFNGTLLDGLLSLKAEHIPYVQNASKFHLNFDINKWKGHPIHDLPYFDRLYEVLGNQHLAGIRFDIILAEKGNVLACATKDLDKKPLHAVSASINIIARLRQIADILHIHPLLGDAPTPEKARNIQRVFTILTEGKRIVLCPRVVIGISHTKQDVLRILSHYDKADHLAITTQEHIEFFSEPILIGTCTRHFSLVDFRNRDALLARLDKAQDSDEIRFEVEGTDDCVLTETYDVGKSVT